MEKTTFLRNAVATACLGLLLPVFAATDAPPHAYLGDARFAVKLGHELYETLDPDFQGRINPEAVATEQKDAPTITPVTKTGEGSRPCQVVISTGYVNLINHLAHAKAIDRIQPGYFQQYLSKLGQLSAGENPPEPPDLVDTRFWTDAVINDQASYFNQMMGLTMAINLSHHYLGHYQKYAGEMLAGKPTPINNFLAPAEWEASVKAATFNSLECAIATEGGVALFEAIDKMPQRPAWTGYIVPPGVNLKKLNVELAKYEAAYFKGNLKVPKPAPDRKAVATRVAAN
jgi:hypothetical protein